MLVVISVPSGVITLLILIAGCRCAGCRLLFSYEILTPAALNFFVSYAEGAVESLWSIDQYFQFVLVLMLSTGLSFQVRAVLIGVCLHCILALGLSRLSFRLRLRV
jgi:Sec-independent protein secretion pathway component TatC